MHVFPISKPIYCVGIYETNLDFELFLKNFQVKLCGISVSSHYVVYIPNNDIFL